jgi:hypothetical protein
LRRSIHGELLKLGFQVAQSTDAKHMVKPHGRSAGQSWWTFLRNHMPEIAAMDLFVVPTLAFSLLYGLRPLAGAGRTQNARGPGGR